MSKVNDISILVDGQSQNMPDGKLALLYVVLRALENDKLAQELLDAAGYVCFDADGNVIYPPPSKKDEDNG